MEHEGERQTIDDWLRDHLGRRLVIAGLTLCERHENGGGGTRAAVCRPPEDLVAGLATFRELWVVWAAADTPLEQALSEAAARDADAVLVWLPEPASDQREDAAPGAAVAREVVEMAEAMGLRDRATLALIGPGVSGAQARRLGFDDGFGSEARPAEVATFCAEEATMREDFGRRGSSPPCYL